MEEKTLTFEEKLSKLLELAKSKKNVLEEKDIHDAFAGEKLTPEKLDRIYDFLDKKHVDVLKMSNDVSASLTTRKLNFDVLMLSKKQNTTSTGS